MYCTCAPTHTYTHAHTKPSDMSGFVLFFFKSYITFSNSCMDLIMFSSCRETEGGLIDESDCRLCQIMLAGMHRSA